MELLAYFNRTNRAAKRAQRLQHIEARRRGPMRGEDWFSTTVHPKITFQSVSIGGSPFPNYRYDAKGNLTIKGITKTVDIYFNYIGETTTPKGSKVYAFEGETTINRNDFAIGNPELPFVGKEAKIEFSVESKK